MHMRNSSNSPTTDIGSDLVKFTTSFVYLSTVFNTCDLFMEINRLGHAAGVMKPSGDHYESGMIFSNKSSYNDTIFSMLLYSPKM